MPKLEKESTEKVRPSLSNSHIEVGPHNKTSSRFYSFKIPRNLPGSLKRYYQNGRLFGSEVDTFSGPTETLSGPNLLKLSGLSLPDDFSRHNVATNAYNNDNSRNYSESHGSDPTISQSPEIEQRPSLDAIKQKMIKASEMITKERSLRDENVAEYMKLITNADRQQIMRIKSVFDKKNHKSSSNIDKLQKKLDGYQKKIMELEEAYERGISLITKMQNGNRRQSLVAQNGAETRIGQATLNDNALGKQQVEDRTSNNYTELSLDYNPSYDRLSQLYANRTGSDNQSYDIIVRSSELQALRESQIEFKNYYNKQVEEMERTLLRQLDDDGLRRETHLNEVNEAQQKEIALLKQELLSIEEKMQYLAHEQARDTQELLERYQTRISKIEMQQQRTETSDAASARALLGKFINLLVSISTIVLVIISTLSGLVRPFVQTRVHLLLTIIAIFVAFLIYHNWNIDKTNAKWYQWNHT